MVIIYILAIIGGIGICEFGEQYFTPSWFENHEHYRKGNKNEY